MKRNRVILISGGMIAERECSGILSGLQRLCLAWPYCLAWSSVWKAGSRYTIQLIPRSNNAFFVHIRLFSSKIWLSCSSKVFVSDETQISNQRKIKLKPEYFGRLVQIRSPIYPDAKLSEIRLHLLLIPFPKGLRNSCAALRSRDRRLDQIFPDIHEPS